MAGKTHKKPTIAVTGPDAGGFPAWFFTSIQVRLAGGKPIRLTPSRRKNIRSFDALIIGGGADVGADLYSEQDDEDNTITAENVTHSFFTVLTSLFTLLIRRLFSYKSSRGQTDPERDQLEMDMIKVAVEKQIPILGICRGMQLLNVFYGGSLSQDISHLYVEYPQIRTVFPKKKVEILPNSRLNEIATEPEIQVNALHDQAIATLGRDLEVAAREPNGVIQAIEHRNCACPVIGVQWHPEFLLYSPFDRDLFRWITDNAKRTTL